MKTMKVLWLITARAGSKGIPDKNIKNLGGLPLLAYRIKSALTLADPEDVWVSTDSQKYADIAASFGATVPFLRPMELATDTAKSEHAILHAMAWAESLGRKYDAIGVLQPTSPFVKPKDLKQAVGNLSTDSEAECIVAVKTTHPNSFYIQNESEYLDVIAERIAKSGLFRRQDLPSEITPCGGFFIAKWDIFKTKQTFYTAKTLSYILPEIYSLDIDQPLDWAWAEFLIEKKVIDVPSLFV